MTKKSVVFASLVLITGAIGISGWMRYESDKYAHRQELLQECLGKKGPHQICFMGDDGSVTLRGKFDSGKVFRRLPPSPFVPP